MLVPPPPLSLPQKWLRKRRTKNKRASDGRSLLFSAFERETKQKRNPSRKSHFIPGEPSISLPFFAENRVAEIRKKRGYRENFNFSVTSLSFFGIDISVISKLGPFTSGLEEEKKGLLGQIMIAAALRKEEEKADPSLWRDHKRRKSVLLWATIVCRNVYLFVRICQHFRRIWERKVRSKEVCFGESRSLSSCSAAGQKISVPVGRGEGEGI